MLVCAHESAGPLLLHWSESLSLFTLCSATSLVNKAVESSQPVVLTNGRARSGCFNLQKCANPHEQYHYKKNGTLQSEFDPYGPNRILKVEVHQTIIFMLCRVWGPTGSQPAQSEEVSDADALYCARFMGPKTQKLVEA